MKPMADLVGLVGGAALALLITLWYSPHLCRLCAVALLTHAETTEGARETRARSWKSFSKRYTSGEGRRPS